MTAASESCGSVPAEAPADNNAVAARPEAATGAAAAPAFNFVKACVSGEKRSFEKAVKKVGKVKAKAADGKGLDDKAVSKKAVREDFVKQQAMQKDVIHAEVDGVLSSEARRASAAAEALLRVRTEFACASIALKPDQIPPGRCFGVKYLIADNQECVSCA